MEAGTRRIAVAELAWRLALAWYSPDRREPAWRRMNVDEVEALFADLGMTTSFSDLAIRYMRKDTLECEAVLFDLDGVLINSSQCITRHWQEWADRHGLELSQIMQVAHGLRSGDTMR